MNGNMPHSQGLEDVMAPSGGAPKRVCRLNPHEGSSQSLCKNQQVNSKMHTDIKEFRIFKATLK